MGLFALLVACFARMNFGRFFLLLLVFVVVYTRPHCLLAVTLTLVEMTLTCRSGVGTVRFLIGLQIWLEKFLGKV